MDKGLPLQQIKSQYEGEWLLLAYTELDEELNVVRGEVIAHSPHRDNIYKQLLQLKPPQAAIEYAGEIPEDWVVVL